LFTAHSVCGKKPKTIEIRGQMEKNVFFYQSPSRLPRWVHEVRKTRAKNSHAWAPLMNKSAKVLHWFGLDCGLFEFFRSSTHKPYSKRKMYSFSNFPTFFGDWFVEHGGLRTST
jgi:hypothetical protein